MAKSPPASVPLATTRLESTPASTAQLLRQIGVAVVVSGLVVGSIAVSIYLASQSRSSATGSSTVRVAADQAWSKDDWPSSVKLYDEMLTIDPYNPIASYRKALALQYLFFEAVDRSPAEAPRSAEQLQMAQAAIDAYQNTLDHLALRKNVYFHLACIHARLGQADEAVDFVERSLRLGMFPGEFRRERSFQSLRLDPRFRQLTDPPPASESEGDVMIGGR